jgi:membrane fusion protein (multidrug efflux system)
VAGHIVPVSAKVSGTVLEVNFHENQYVKQGQVLVRLDPSDYNVALSQAEASLNVAQHQGQAAEQGISMTSGTTGSQVMESAAALSQAQSGIGVAQQEVATAQATVQQQQEGVQTARTRVEAARAQLADAEHNLARMQALYKQEFISQAELDRAETTYSTTKAQYDTARQQVSEAQAGLAAAQARVGQARANVSQAQGGARQAAAALGRMQAQTGQVGVQQQEALAQGGRVQQAEAQLKQAKLNLSYTTIIAPVSGVIGRKNVEIGQVVQPNQPLFSIVPMENVWVEANYKETELRGIQIGSPAEVKVDAYPNRIFRGTVESIGAATGSQFSMLPPENASGNFVKVVQWLPVRIRLEGGNPGQILRPGMSVEADITRQKT